MGPFERHWYVGLRFLAVALIAFTVSACGGQPTPTDSRRASPSPTGPIASNLPPGVCAPTYDQLQDPNATRIEAKLVTRDVLMKSDPNFAPSWHTDTTYFWVVASVGRFTMDGPMPPGATPPVLHNVIGILQASIVSTDPESVAHPCRGIAVEGTGGTAWPAWFDQMTAIVKVTIK